MTMIQSQKHVYIDREIDVKEITVDYEKAI